MTDLPPDRTPPTRSPVGRGPTSSAEESLDRIWRRIRRPFNTPVAVEALVGFPPRTSQQLVAASVAGSSAASALMAAMPALIRSLSISTVSVPQRSVGQVRGPILWSETLAARSASAGDPGVFVCSTMERAYDTPENRTLAWALDLVVRGGKEIDKLHRHDVEEPPLFAAARRNGDLALRFLDHRTLNSVRRRKPDRRSLAKIQHNSRRRAYQPVIDMLRVADEPLDIQTLRLFCDAETTAEHDLLIAVIDQIERRGIPVPPFLVAKHALEAGRVRYCHVAHSSDADLPAGVSIGSVHLVVPSAASTGADRRVVRGRGDVIAAVDAAIAAGEL